MTKRPCVHPSMSNSFDHPIFLQSLIRIEAILPHVAVDYPPLEREVLFRLVHSSGDPNITSLFRYSDDACSQALTALAQGCPILTDTAMAAAAVSPMARRTFGNPVHCILQWAPPVALPSQTRTALGMKAALNFYPSAVFLIGSSPTALELLLDSVDGSGTDPALVIGMPVGFIGVAQSKRRLAASGLPQIRLEGSRGGAGLVAAAVNALLRRAWLDLGV